MYYRINTSSDDRVTKVVVVISTLSPTLPAAYILQHDFIVTKILPDRTNPAETFRNFKERPSFSKPKTESAEEHA